MSKKSQQKRREAKSRRRDRRKKKRRKETAIKNEREEVVALAWEDIGREEARETMSDSEYFFWQLGHPGESPSEEELAAEIEKLSKASWMTPENIESYARQRRIGIERPALDI